METILAYIPLIIKANEIKKFYDQEKLKELLDEKKKELWNRCLNYNFYTYYLYHKSLFIIKPNLSLILYLKITKRVLINFYRKLKPKATIN